jgi:hypothetical protein
VATDSDRKELTVAWGMTVDGWQWYQSKEGISAVRMVPVRMWQWQYWQSCGGLKKE